MHQSLAEDKYVRLNAGDQPIPGFRLVRRRGRGGFGEVWEAEASGGFLVALKFVRLSIRARAAELRSLDFVRAIHHPNLLANFGSWQSDDTLIIGMELADRSLWDRYVEASDQGLRGIPRGELLGYLADVAAGISYLNDYRHSVEGRTGLGIQHRDIKPSNILLFGGGAKVADLGMARLMEGEVAGHTGIWTFAYAAPEFFRGETTRQSDQYGLAATYCQLRGGRLPFEGNTAAMTAGHLFGRPDLEALPEAERPILERALAKVAADRWPDCRSFIDALRAIPAGDVPDVLVEPDGPSEIPREFRSSTGSLSDLEAAPEGRDPRDPNSSWRRFESVDSLEIGIFAPAEPREASSEEQSISPDFVATRILPAYDPGPEPEDPASEPPEGPITATSTSLSSWAEDPSEPESEFEPEPGFEPEPEPRRRWARLGRLAVAASVVAVALATANLHAPPFLEPGPSRPGPAPTTIARRPPTPAEVIAGGIGHASEPDPEPDEATPPEIPTPAPRPVEALPAPAPASIKPEPAPALPAPAPTRDDGARLAVGPPIEAAPPAGPVRPPAEPPPAQAAPPVIVSKPRPASGPESKPAQAPSDPTDLVLEAPLELEISGFNVASSVPKEERAPGPKAPTAANPPAVQAAKPGVEPPPAENSPSRVIAYNSPSPTLSPFSRFTPTAARLGPSPAEAAFARGGKLLDQGSFQSAIDEFSQAILLDPTHAASFLNRGLARHNAKAPHAALADYDEAIRLHRDDASAYIARGQAYHDLREYDKAVKDFTEAIRLRPGDADARFRRGYARYRSNDFKGAVADFDKVILIDKDHVRAHEFRTYALDQLGAPTGRAAAAAATPGRPGTMLSPLPTPGTIAPGLTETSAKGPPGPAADRNAAPGARGPSGGPDQPRNAPPPGAQPPNPRPGPRPPVRGGPGGKNILKALGRALR